MKQADLKHMFRKASKSVHASTIMISADSLCSVPSNSSVMKTPENTERTLMTLNQQMEISE
jgi:hypothetical protein